MKRLLLSLWFALAAGLAHAEIDVAFSPEAGSETLVLRVIGSAQKSIKVAAYSFTSPQIVRALLGAKDRGVDVQVLIDDKGNRGKANTAAKNLLLGAGIPLRTIGAYAIHHDKYIVADESTVQTGSLNYSRAAARANSENVIVIWNDPKVAAAYSLHWASRWERGTPAAMTY